MKNKLLLMLSLAFMTSYFGGGHFFVAAESSDKDSQSSKHEDPDGYYTCSMHPQVHEHKPGKCPICGMPLIKTKKPILENNQEKESSEIQVSSGQLALAGIGKYTVTKKDLSFAIPVSGRMMSSKEVVLQIFESDLALVKSGMEFTGAVSSSPDDKLLGELRSIDNFVDPSSRTVRVTGILNQAPKRSVMEGSFYGEIIAKEKNQITIPEQAVMHTGRGDLVYIFTTDNKLKAQSVILGKRADQEYQVLSGLKEGEVISSGPNFLIDSEAKIRGGR